MIFQNINSTTTKTPSNIHRAARPSRPPLTFLARRTPDDLRAAAVARAAVLEILG